MANYSKVKRTKYFSAILGLLLSVVIMSMLSGCGSSPSYSISGRITSGGSALPGVTVTLDGNSSRATKTDTKGNYNFNDVSSGIFTVTPSLAGYAFSPTYRNVWVEGLDANGFNFSASSKGRVEATTHTVYLKNDGTVWVWGNNSNGQLGNGSTTQSAVALQISGLSSVTAVAAGYAHTVALKSDGTVWAWGNNSNGQLGNGTTTDSSIPAQAWLSGMVAIAAGNTHTVALRNDVTNVSVWAWGNNSHGQLGNGTTTDSSTPVQVSGLSEGTAIAAGSGHTVVLKNDGTVWAWGNNSHGQLGNGSTTNSSIPVQVSGLSEGTAIAAGYEYTVGLRMDNEVWAWGNNFYGQLGDGTTIDRWIPVQVQ